MASRKSLAMAYESHVLATSKLKGDLYGTTRAEREQMRINKINAHYDKLEAKAKEKATAIWDEPKFTKAEFDLITGVPPEVIKPNRIYHSVKARNFCKANTADFKCAIKDRYLKYVSVVLTKDSIVHVLKLRPNPDVFVHNGDGWELTAYGMSILSTGKPYEYLGKRTAVDSGHMLNYLDRNTSTCNANGIAIGISNRNSYYWHDVEISLSYHVNTLGEVRLFELIPPGEKDISLKQFYDYIMPDCRERAGSLMTDEKRSSRQRSDKAEANKAERLRKLWK